MLDLLLTYKAGIGLALSFLAASVTVLIFQVLFGFSWMVAVPVGVLAYISTPIVWTRLIAALEQRQPPASR